MRFHCLIVSVLFSAFYCAPVPAQPDDSRIKVGLALSGGGARGGAHVGVLKALEELNVPIDYIAGASMGAIVGGFYAAGYSADEIAVLLEETDWDFALTDQPDRRDRTMRKKEIEDEFLIPYRLGYNDGEVQAALGVIEGQHLDQIFQRILFRVVGIDDFDRLPVPFRATATDLATGEEVVLGSGSLADALRASMSVPGVFSPVRIDGRMLVDGGLSNNLPVSVVRAMGADVVIAVDISMPLMEEEQLTSVLSVTEQLTNFLTRRNTDQQISTLGPGDILITPELEDVGSADFKGIAAVVPRGYDAALFARSELLVLARPDGLRPPLPLVPDLSRFEVQFVEIDNGSVLDDELVRSRLAVTPGDTLDVEELNRSIDRIYSLDVFESVTYDLVRNERGEHGVRVTASPRSWGPNYLQFGLELSNDFSGNSDFKIGAGYTRNALNRLGGELRVIGSIGREDELRFDYYQPVDFGANWFVNPQLKWKRSNYSLWLDELRFAEFELSGGALRIGGGRNLGTTQQLRLDYRFGRFRADLLTGFLPGDWDDRIDIGELDLNYRQDNLDSLYFPTSGSRNDILYRYGDEALGAASDYQQAQALGTFARSWGRNTAVFNYQLGYSFDDEAPLERWYQLGGFTRLSGLAPDQLTGRHSALASMALYRRLNDISFLPVYAGLTLETGNTWNLRREIGLDDLRYSGSLFVGAETLLGPVYFAVGYSDGGQGAVYFYLGNPFRYNEVD
jgi:NTE family protein